jgi:hypothetical protein
MTNDTQNFLLAVSAALIITILIAIAPDAKEERIAQQALYCEMVELSIETDGEFGWPDFRNRYTKDC